MFSISGEAMFCRFPLGANAPLLWQQNPKSPLHNNYSPFLWACDSSWSISIISISGDSDCFRDWLITQVYLGTYSEVNRMRYALFSSASNLKRLWAFELPATNCSLSIKSTRRRTELRDKDIVRHLMSPWIKPCLHSVYSRNFLITWANTISFCRNQFGLAFLSFADKRFLKDVIAMPVDL